MTIADPDIADQPVIFANRAFSELTGRGLEDIAGFNCGALIGALFGGSDACAAFTGLMNEAAESGRAAITVDCARVDGSTFVDCITLAMLEIGGGRRIAVASHLPHEAKTTLPDEGDCAAPSARRPRGDDALVIETRASATLLLVRRMLRDGRVNDRWAESAAPRSADPR